jgi:competence protein ComK
MSFLIDEKVCAIIPYYNEYGELCSRVVKDDGDIKLKISPIRLLEESCITYGSTFRGRIEAIKYLMGFKKRIPLTVSCKKNIFAFPINSHLRKDEIWIFTNKVLKYREVKKSVTRITFRNFKEIDIEISFSSFDSQFNRSIACIYHLRQNLSVKIDE